MLKNLIDLVILRHGEAERTYPDRQRSLTEYGREQILNQSQWMQAEQFQPQLILHSPYARTEQTALQSKELFPQAVLQAEPLLVPDGDHAMVLSMLPTLENASILLISHMPMVAYLTAGLLPDHDAFAYPVAGLCWFQLSLDGSANKLITKSW